CVPLVLGQPVSTITGGIAADPLPAAILDGKILFNTAGRDASITNGVGLGAPAPLFNDASRPENAKMPGSVVSTAHDASYVTCSTCRAASAGRDGRPWDSSQFAPPIRTTMARRGGRGFSPATGSNVPSKQCFSDAACGDAKTDKMNPKMIPPNIPAAD